MNQLHRAADSGYIAFDAFHGGGSLLQRNDPLEFMMPRPAANVCQNLTMPSEALTGVIKAYGKGLELRLERLPLQGMQPAASAVLELLGQRPNPN